MSVTHLQGDCRDVLKTLPDKSVQCCVTSPPYWGLRDYGVDGQLGLEKTPDEYVANMVAVFRDVRRVLRDDGTLWLNLGDSYAGGGTTGRNDADTIRAIDAHSGRRPNAMSYGDNDRGGRSKRAPVHGLKPKDLVGIPWMVAFALRADGWYLRSDIIWAKPNPMPESVTDRPTKAHEYLFLLTKSPIYVYDADAIAEASVDPPGVGRGGSLSRNGTDPFIASAAMRGAPAVSSGTRNRRSVWTVATRPYKGAHFATFPPKLIEPCILAGTSPQTCEHCAAPWERVTSRGDAKAPTFAPLAIAESGALPDGPGTHRNMGGRYQKYLDENPKQTVGWQPTCDCADNTGAGRCVVLDPFGGSGTTAMVAEQHGRNAILIELNESYIGLQHERMAKVQPSLGVA